MRWEFLWNVGIKNLQILNRYELLHNNLSLLLTLIIFVQRIIDELIKEKDICYWRDCYMFELYTKTIFMDMNERKYGNSSKNALQKKLWWKKNSMKWNKKNYLYIFNFFRMIRWFEKNKCHILNRHDFIKIKDHLNKWTILLKRIEQILFYGF